MNKYESIRADMTTALKNGDKLRRLTLADIIATIDKTSTSVKTRVEITDALVDEVLIKYKKTVQEMIDTCPDSEQYAARKAEYVYNMTVVEEYAPKLIEDESELETLIKQLCAEIGAELIPANKGSIMRIVMPALKTRNCDMKKAQSVLNKLF